MSWAMPTGIGAPHGLNGNLPHREWPDIALHLYLTSSFKAYFAQDELTQVLASGGTSCYKETQ